MVVYTLINQYLKNSALEKRVVAHESQHLKDMSNGSLSYTDDYVRYNGKTYPRRDGKDQI